MKVPNNIKTFRDKLAGTNCLLVAVSKTKPNEDIMDAYDAGHRDFGENKVQELITKSQTLPKDIHWHMIGHLQRNKVKYIAPFVHLIHAVDSWKLLVEINKQGEKNHRVLRCLLQVHIAEESAKFGFSEDEVSALLQTENLGQLQFIDIVGLMGMATNTSDIQQVKKEFRSIKQLFEACKKNENANVHITQLSIGMSADYAIAIEEGTTIIRVGSAIFGERN